MKLCGIPESLTRKTSGQRIPSNSRSSTARVMGEMLLAYTYTNTNMFEELATVNTVTTFLVGKAIVYRRL